MMIKWQSVPTMVSKFPKSELSQQKKKQNYGRIDLSLDNILNWSLWTPMEWQRRFYRLNANPG